MNQTYPISGSEQVRYMAQDNEDEQTECSFHAPLTADCLDRHQQNFILIVRCYFMSYTVPQSCSWELGVETAVHAYGSDRGPQIAWACLKCVQEMRTSRKTTFKFCNPFCKCCRNRLTQHEQHLVESFDYARRGADGALSLTSMMLCEGNDDKEFVRSLHALQRAVLPESATVN